MGASVKLRFVSKEVERGLRVLATPLQIAIATGQAPDPRLMRSPDARALAAALKWLGEPKGNK